MRIGQALGLRHADIRSYDGAIDIVPRANSNGALAKSRSPYVVHVSKQAMALYADYLVHEYGEVSHDYVFVNWWGGQVGAPMRYATVIDLFRQLSKRTGLRATPHMFRRTHATDLLRAGWDAAYVQRRLGHAHIQNNRQHLCPLVSGRHGRDVRAIPKGACAMSTNAVWNRATQAKLIAELQGTTYGTCTTVP
jgi:integrase